MRSTKMIMETLAAMGATPTVTTDSDGNDIIKINAPTVKSCETCVNRETCTKTIGNMFGYCNIDYKGK